MPITRKLVRLSPITLSVALLLAPISHAVPGAGPQPPQPPESTKRTGVDVEVKFIDDSTMKLKVLDEKLELVTKYGILHVAVSDIRRIDFAARVPADVAEKVVVAISKLGHSDFKIREAATAELKEYRERAYPFVVKALKFDDPEVVRRADEIVKYIQSKVPAAHLQASEFDVVQTDDSKITGRLTAEVLRVSTFQFGDQQLKLADIRMLRTNAGVAAEAIAAAPQAPGNLSAYQQQFGKELAFTVTAFTPAPGVNASVWGTDIYTLDSNLSAAVVHAGLAKPGETITIRVRVVQSPPQFVSSFRNGVSSTAYGHYPAGGYEFVRK
ncbi:MAG: hypothetical protein L0241_07890 [Planctomycetia bacterium]|nr:hypothetical protein [Planctomycetia bacterium]